MFISSSVPGVHNSWWPDEPRVSRSIALVTGAAGSSWLTLAACISCSLSRCCRRMPIVLLCTEPCLATTEVSEVRASPPRPLSPPDVELTVPADNEDVVEAATLVRAGIFDGPSFFGGGGGNISVFLLGSASVSPSCNRRTKQTLPKRA